MEQGRNNALSTSWMMDGWTAFSRFTQIQSLVVEGEKRKRNEERVVRILRRFELHGVT